jgi:signal transduction histidine kinase
MFVGVAAIAVSTGPGWRSLRWFGIAALCASVYAMCAMVTSTAVSDDIRPAVARMGGASASALVGAWFVYLPVAQGRKLARWERWVAGGIFFIASMWLVPGLCRTSEIFVRHVSWLGASYTTTRPTLLGKVAYTALSLLTAAVAVRVFRWWRQGRPGTLAQLIGISVQLVAGVNDALAASGRIDMPYMLDVGQFVVVLAIGTNLIGRFVSDARALERSSAELRAAQKELVRKERLAALGELSAVVAHEVRNPLTVIFNAVSSLRKQNTLSGDTRTLLDILEEEAERLKRVVGELLEFARPRDLLVDAVAPAPLVDGAVEAASAAYGKSGEVAIDTQAELPNLEGDEQLLRQALINLITNALQAGGRRSPVRVETKCETKPVKSISFRVLDDGDGVPKEVAERLFTPFFTTRASGTGLGLAIVKRIAEAHAGEVLWQPGEPRGAIFTLRVPVQKP